MRLVCNQASAIGEITECRKVQKIFFLVCERGVSMHRFHARTQHSHLLQIQPRGMHKGLQESNSPTIITVLSAVEIRGAEILGYTPLPDVLTPSWIFEPTRRVLIAKMDVTVNSCWT